MIANFDGESDEVRGRKSMTPSSGPGIALASQFLKRIMEKKVI
jgi:hypothetical protein